MNRLQIESYLRFGYDITFDDWRYEFDFSRINKLPYANKNLPELIQIGAQILMNSLQQLYENNEMVVVPTSGGVDSRVLLGFMLKHKESKDIKTYTFGVPNTYDFDIGNQITKYCNTNHMVFDLNKHNYSLDELVETSRCMSHQSPLCSR
jgi:asparagine synthetase B (glutamine-hydrolysing)